MSPLQGRAFSKAVHRADDEQVICLYEKHKKYLKEVLNRFLKGTTHFEINAAGALQA
ncbi:hypothetical protein LU604_26240 (plasmid) [Erwinia tracheiphila]|uniref:hypothetical protein n=1 Tax=Erwinia tracheiphila TaxID=65700 RepID=UPI001F26E478|nr:hypothetical protein [Erwinia tracheiphila]UIA85950.1 hypothetical protein LU604_26240 [Erwinia tracheiphila]UIA94474.1 hypothetical protein LU632_25710 [Erwinia tracheiphila]